MKTSMAYRLFRLYFNSNADNYQLFGNRVYNPMNGVMATKDAFWVSIVRVLIVLATLGLLFSASI